MGKSLMSREHASAYMRRPCNGHDRVMQFMFKRLYVQLTRLGVKMMIVILPVKLLENQI